MLSAIKATVLLSLVGFNKAHQADRTPTKFNPININNFPLNSTHILASQSSLDIHYLSMDTRLPKDRAAELMNLAPIPDSLLRPSSMSILEESVFRNGVEIYEKAKQAYSHIAEVILLLKQPKILSLGNDHPTIKSARANLNRAIDSIGPTHGGVVARLSETMIGVLERGIEDGKDSENLSQNELKVIQNYLKILMSEFPKKGREIIESFDHFYENTSTQISKDNAKQAIRLFREIKTMWESPLYFQGDMPHIVILNTKLQTAAELLGVRELNPNNQSPEDLSPHIVLLNDAIMTLKEGIGLDSIQPAHMEGIFNNPGILDSSIAIVTGHIMPVRTEMDRVTSMGGAELWEWTANFRTPLLAQLLVAAGAASNMQDMPLYIPTHVIGEECHKDESHDANQHIDFVAPDQKEAYEKGIMTLKQLMIPFYEDLTQLMARTSIELSTVIHSN